MNYQTKFIELTIENQNTIKNALIVARETTLKQLETATLVDYNNSHREFKRSCKRKIAKIKRVLKKL